MQIAVLGTGTVGRALAARLAELGHHVVLGTRDPAATRSREDWAEVPGVELGTFAAAAEGAEVVVHAGNGAAALDLLGAAGDLAGKVLVDVSNPLDFSAGFPPTLSVKDTDSLGEQVQRAFPDARVVKTLNTLTADLMVHPERLPEPTSVFVSGDDAAAKDVVTGLLTAMGHRDVIDLGGIETSRGVEMWLPLWLRLMGTFGTADFNLKVVRGS
ncbi:NADPH-dependent F420 reductase [Nocardioides okcheonensis]|uniref:NADPH-dependent F420 reductase n=1 Tax=Nocardioides okcheonensis TaxID=2894081 RepID=UPI001E4F5C67|nr:NAD(P)-binding domain-containing protein [Nocardioides okcheonensis]UFN45947.1 NAD(P)-binding domain-containing protein [Nocardioides okcheonensis]